MPTYRLVAKVDEQPDKSYLVRAPAVGVADGVPREGVFLNPLDSILTLEVLNRRYVVQLPRKVRGMVAEQLIEDTATPVAYGQPLLRLTEPAALGGDAAGEGAAAGKADSADNDLIAITAPSAMLPAASPRYRRR